MRKPDGVDNTIKVVLVTPLILEHRLQKLYQIINELNCKSSLNTEKEEMLAQIRKTRKRKFVFNRLPSRSLALK